METHQFWPEHDQNDHGPGNIMEAQIVSAPSPAILSDIYSGIHSDIHSDILSGIYSDILSGILLSGLCSGPWLHPQLRFLASKNFGPLDPPTTEMAQILFAAWELPLSPHRPRQCPAGTKGFPPSPELVFRENTYPPKKKGKVGFFEWMMLTACVFPTCWH